METTSDLFGEVCCLHSEMCDWVELAGGLSHIRCIYMEILCSGVGSSCVTLHYSGFHCGYEDESDHSWGYEDRPSLHKCKDKSCPQKSEKSHLTALIVVKTLWKHGCPLTMSLHRKNKKTWSHHLTFIDLELHLHAPFLHCPHSIFHIRTYPEQYINPKI